jgi:predicted transcriptional regulator
VSAERQVDSIGPFLKTMQRRKAASELSDNPERPGGAAVSILSKLAERGPTPATELLTETGLSLVDFARNLDSLTELGFIKVSRAGDVEIAELTPTGLVLAESSASGGT